MFSTLCPPLTVITLQEETVQEDLKTRKEYIQVVCTFTIDQFYYYLYVHCTVYSIFTCTVSFLLRCTHAVAYLFSHWLYIKTEYI